MSRNGSLEYPAAGRSRKWILGILFAVGVAAGWYGMDFSPGFSAMYFWATVVLITLSTLVRGILSRGALPPEVMGTEEGSNRNGSFLLGDILPMLLFCAGAAFAVAACYIYAMGDDRLEASIRWTALLTLISMAMIWLPFYWHPIYRKNQESLGIPARHGRLSGQDVSRPYGSLLLTTLFSLAAGWFLCFCGLQSTALIPCGVAMLLMAASEICIVLKKDRIRYLLVLGGIFLLDSSLICPLFFAG